MPNGLNQCLFMGNLTHTPETIRYTASGTAVMEFTLAVNEYEKGKENNQHVEYVKVVVFGGRCEFIKGFCQRGDTLMIQGKLRQEKFTPSRGKNAGVERVIVKIIAEKIEPIRLNKWSKPQDRQPTHPSPGPYDDGPEPPPIDDSDPPF